MVYPVMLVPLLYDNMRNNYKGSYIFLNTSLCGDDAWLEKKKSIILE